MQSAFLENIFPFQFRIIFKKDVRNLSLFKDEYVFSFHDDT